MYIVVYSIDYETRKYFCVFLAARILHGHFFLAVFFRVTRDALCEEGLLVVYSWQDISDSRQKTNQTSLCSGLNVVYVVIGVVVFRLLCYQIDWLVLLHYVGLSRKMKRIKAQCRFSPIVQCLKNSLKTLCN